MKNQVTGDEISEMCKFDGVYHVSVEVYPYYKGTYRLAISFHDGPLCGNKFEVDVEEVK